MIRIQKSPTADTRTCDFASVTREQLLASSVAHIQDVRQGLSLFASMLKGAAEVHDADKITDIEGFHRDFLTGFKTQEWFTKHRQLNRHHLQQADGVPADVNLIDVLDFIVDCVMSGMARAGTIYDVKIDTDVLCRAFANTVELLLKNVEVGPIDGAPADPPLAEAELPSLQWFIDRLHPTKPGYMQCHGFETEGEADRQALVWKMERPDLSVNKWEHPALVRARILREAERDAGVAPSPLLQMAKPPVSLTPVRSSNIAAIGADGDDALVMFRSGHAYRYVGAGSRVPEAFQVDSVGQWVNAELINRSLYTVIKLTDEQRGALTVKPWPAGRADQDR